MSTGLNCLFIEISRDAWYYILESGHAPKCTWDWREYAQAYGPFASEDAAHDDLRRNHANPGGAEIMALPDGVECRDMSADPVLTNLIADADKRKPQSGLGPR